MLLKIWLSLALEIVQTLEAAELFFNLWPQLMFQFVSANSWLGSLLQTSNFQWKSLDENIWGKSANVKYND